MGHVNCLYRAYPCFTQKYIEPSKHLPHPHVACALLQAAGTYYIVDWHLYCAAACRELAEEAVNSAPKLDAYPFLKSAMLQAVADAVLERWSLASEDVGHLALWLHYALATHTSRCMIAASNALPTPS